MAKQLTVIGGGAAGIFCAINAARMNPGVKVLILEKSNRLLSKVRVSGGGRCNVTHACFDIGAISKKYPRGGNFVKKSFHHFFTTDTIRWFEDRGIQLKAEQDGRMFPVSNSSQTIIDCFLNEVNKYRVDIWLNAGVEEVTIHDDKFRITISGSRVIDADLVCIACGGYPKLSMFSWLIKLGHSIEEPVPSLFTFNMPARSLSSLMGITIDEAVVKIAGTKMEERGPLLITHWGMSGPAILKLSAWGARELAGKKYHFTVFIKWLPEMNEQRLREKLQELRFVLASQKIANRNPFQLPHRFWEYLLHEAGIKPDIRWADLPAKEQNKLTKILSAQEFEVKGKTTFKEEFVTAGGIRLNEVDPNSMMSRKINGLFFAGEILDVDGVTGGFNFQHAWTSGYIVARSVSTLNT